MNMLDGNMQFYSFKFLIFLSLAFTLFYVTGKNLRSLILLILCYIFYSVFNIKHLPLLIFVTCLNFIGAKYLGKISEISKRKYVFFLVLSLNLLILFLFKYLNFAIENINFVFTFIGIRFKFPIYSINLPIGLSFFTFATLGYVIDVYRRNVLPDKNYLKFSLFTSFFPLVQSGPIERSNNFLKQLDNEITFNYNNIKSGLFTILSGLIKKYLIADRLALICNPFFEDISNFSSAITVIAVITFAFQIYYDFSGYTDIAVGIGKLFGYEINKNFNNPYSSRSISEFWKKWHISLSQWLRDYIFLPIAYVFARRFQSTKIMKPENISYYSAVIITMFVTGLWHGASWNYIIWGLIFAIVMVISQSSKRVRKKFLTIFNLNRFKKSLGAFKILYTFALVCFAWIFFRTETIPKALQVIDNIFNYKIWYLKSLTSGFNILIQKVPLLTVLLGYSLLILSEVFQLLERKYQISLKFYELNSFFRWVVYTLIIFMVFLLAVTGDNKFLYFKY